MTIGDRIKQRREDLGLSVEDVAQKLGKHRATIYRYESNEIENMPADVLEPLATVLETTPAALMGWENTQLTDEYSQKFCKALMEELCLLFPADDENLDDYNNLLELASSNRPLSLAEACEAADKLGGTLGDLLKDTSHQEDLQTTSQNGHIFYGLTPSELKPLQRIIEIYKSSNTEGREAISSMAEGIAASQKYKKDNLADELSEEIS